MKVNILLILSMATLTACGSSNEQAKTVEQTVVKVTAANFMLGVGTHIFGQDIDQNIKAINEIGLDSIRDDFLWSSVEQSKGTLIVPEQLELYTERLTQSGVSPLLILDYGNSNYDSGAKPVSKECIDAFINYAIFSVTKTDSRVNHFEIWNEWDLSYEPTSAESYFELVKAVAPAIRAINSNTVVLAGAAWLQCGAGG